MVALADDCSGVHDFLVFGGRGMVTAGEELLGDLWTFSLSTRAWLRVPVEGSVRPGTTSRCASCWARLGDLVYVS